MALTEGRRKRLHDKFEEVLGLHNAETAMELLPPVGWADVATNRELDHLRAAMEREFGHVRAEIDHAQAELAERIAATDQRIVAAEQRMLAALHQEVAAVHKELATMHQHLAGIHQQLAGFVRSIVIWGTGLVTALASLAFTAGHLL